MVSVFEALLDPIKAVRSPLEQNDADFKILLDGGPPDLAGHLSDFAGESLSDESDEWKIVRRHVFSGASYSSARFEDF